MISPHFNYCLLIWGSNTNDIFILQKKASYCIVSRSDVLAHIDFLFKLNNLLKLEDLYKLRILKFYFNLQNNNLPQQFLYLMPSRGILRYKFRHSSCHLPKVTHEFAKNCLSYNLTKVINNTRRNIVEKITTHSILK